MKVEWLSTLRSRLNVLRLVSISPRKPAEKEESLWNNFRRTRIGEVVDWEINVIIWLGRGLKVARLVE